MATCRRSGTDPESPRRVTLVGSAVRTTTQVATGNRSAQRTLQGCPIPDLPVFPTLHRIGNHMEDGGKPGDGGWDGPKLAPTDRVTPNPINRPLYRWARARRHGSP